MAQLRKYEIVLHPAQTSDHGFVSIMITNVVARKTVEANSLPTLLDHVKTFAEEQKQGCSAWVRIADGGRKPAGFDKATNKLFYNLEAAA